MARGYPRLRSPCGTPRFPQGKGCFFTEKAQSGGALSAHKHSALAPHHQGSKGQIMKRKSFFTVTVIGVALVLGSTTSASADTTPTSPPKIIAPLAINNPFDSATATALAAYQVALTKYKADLVVYQAAMVTYKAAKQANQDKRKVINTTFNVALASARATFQTFLATNPNATAAQKTAAIATRDAAIATANSIRTAALAAISPGVPPVKPHEPIRPVKPKKGEKGENGEGAENSAKPLKTDGKAPKKS